MLAALAQALLLFVFPPQEPSAAAANANARLRGRVVDATSGAPIPAAIVEILPARIGEDTRRLLASATGEFELVEVSRGSRIAVAPPPLQATHVPRIVLANIDSTTRELVLQLEPALAIDGRVLDEFEAPMASVRVIAEPLDAPEAFALRREHFTDDRGIFRVFGLANGRYRVCAIPQRSGRPPAYSKTCEPADAGTASVTIRMRRAAAEQRPAPTRPESWIAIRGRVSDEQTGQPLARAFVSLAPDSVGDAYEVVADARARFEVHVPPGPYNLRAAAGEFTSTHVVRSHELLIMPGDTFGDFEIALPRARAVSGFVTHAGKTPLADVAVELVPEGGTTPLWFAHALITDDRGQFRVHGVPPGRYTVCGNPPSSSGPSAARPWVYARGCFPALVDLTRGDSVLSPIRLEQQGSYSITGWILGVGSDVPPGTIVTLVRRSETQFRTATLPIRADGSFVASNLTPGVYELSAASGLNARDQSAALWANTRVEVVDADLRGVMLQLSEGGTIRGRVTIDEPGIDRPLRGIEVRAFPVGAAAPRATPVETDEDGTFELRRLFGSIVLRVRTPQGFVVKSIRHAGREIADVPTEFGNDTGFTTDILLSRATAELSGRVRDDLGRAVEDAGVLYFPADRARWKAYEGGLRQQSLGGRYHIKGLVGGDYLVIAVKGPRPGWTEKDYELLAPFAERVTVQDGEARVVDLRVVTLTK